MFASDSCDSESPSAKWTVAVVALLCFSGCGNGILTPAGPVGRSERIILLDSLAIMLAVVVPTILAALAFAWWYRASNAKARYRPRWAYSGRLELIIWSIPTLVILFLGGVIWTGSHELDPANPPDLKRPLEIQVISLDWKWLFIYPEQGIASVNQLVIPTGQPVHFSLTSASVMSAFFVPQLGSMIAMMHRMVTQLYLKADQSGDYYGESTQFSGEGFADMHFIVHAVSSKSFDQWVNDARRVGPALDHAEYAILAKQSANVRPFTYRTAEPDLFRGVVNQRLAPGPGPAIPLHDATVHPQGKS